MGKKYLDTKKGTLESSILGVWQNAIEESDARMDGRTKEYREHRKQLESARSRREEKKVSIKKEQPETEHGSGEKVFELGTDRYAEYTQKITPGQDVDLDEAKGTTKYVVMQGPGDNNQKVIATFDGGPKALEKAKKFRDDWNKKNKSKIKLDKKGKPIAAHMARIFDKGVETSYKVGDKVSYSAFAPSIIKDEVDLDEAPVNPKEREELDIDVKNSAQKMKRSKEPAPNQMTEAQSGDKEAYKKFFEKALKKFKVDSPADFKSDEEKKEFYDYVDKNWEGDNEKAEGAMSQVREFKIQSMKAALAQVWGMEEGKNPVKKEDDEKEVVKNGKTETGKKPAVIDLKPKIKD